MTCGCVITFTQGHLGKVNVTSTKKEKFVFGLYLFYVETLEVLFSPKIAYDLKFDMTLTHGQLGRFKVIVYKNTEFKSVRVMNIEWMVKFDTNLT